MLDQYVETISGEKSILTIVNYLIDARVIGKIGISDTEHSWMTMILDIKKIKGSSFLSMDKIEGFESVLSPYPNREVSLEFMDKGGVPCRFRTTIVKCRPKHILTELPKEIYRIQKRQYLRVNASPGTEIAFRMDSSEQERGEVKDLSGGGAAFFLEKDLRFEIGNLLNDISLKIPEGNEWFSFQIAQAIIRRIVRPSFSETRTLCATEFSEMSRGTRDKLTSHISEQQAVVIQRLNE
jgi:c-di-GMP-binding flagellar brake protein YcgR